MKAHHNIIYYQSDLNYLWVLHETVNIKGHNIHLNFNTEEELRAFLDDLIGG